MTNPLEIITVGPVNFTESVSGDIDTFTARIINGQPTLAFWQLTNEGANVWSGHVESGGPNDATDSVTVTVPMGIEIRGYSFSVSNVLIANPAEVTVTRLSGGNSLIATHGFSNMSSGSTLGADSYLFMIGNGTVVADWVLTLNVAYVAPLGTTTQNQIFSGNALTLDSDTTNNSDTIIRVGGSTSLGTAVAGTAGGTFTMNANGSFVFDPGDDFRHLDQGQQANTAVIYTWERADGSEVNGTAAITVTGVNDAPVVAGSTAVTASEGASGVLATYTVSDPDTSDTPTLSLGGADAALFNLNASGQLTFKNGPDYEAPADSNHDNQYEITIVGNDGTVSTPLAVTVAVQNTAPQVADQAFGPVSEAAAAGTVVGTLVASEATAFSITGGNAAGIFAIDNTGKITIANTAALNFEAATSHALTIQATDGTATDSASVTVSIANVDEAPSGSGSLTQTTLQDNAGATALFGSLTVTDPENETDLALRVTVSNPAAGVISGVGGTTVVNAGGGVYTISGLTAAAANTALDNLRFTPANNTGTSGTLTTNLSVEVNDGSTGYRPVLGATGLTINIVNDAPVLTAGNPTLPATVENAAAGTIAGLTVTELLSRTGGVTDADSSAFGIAVTAADGSRGTWQYSSDGGTTWNGITGVSATAALLLAETDKIRFVPAADTAGTVTDGLSFKAWDKTVGAAGGTANTTAGTAFSSASAAVDITVANVAPVIADATPPVVNENAAVATLVHTMDSSAGDPNGLTNWRITAGNGGNLFTISSTGQISLAGTLDFETTQQHVLTVAVDDESGATDTAQVTINVGDIDDTPPAAVGIAVSGTPAPAANAIAYTVTFSESVSGVDAADFSLVTTTGNAAGTVGTPVTTDGGTTWTVPVTGITGTGALRLVLKATGTGIQDGAGNAIQAGYASGAVHTVDRDAPTLDAASSAPADDAQSVMIASNIVVDFSETVGFATGTVRLVDTATGATVLAFDVATAAGGIITAANGSTATLVADKLTIDPAASLAGVTRYRIEIDAGALVDAAGNPIAAIGSGVYEFTTEDPTALYTEAAGFATGAADGDGNGIADADNGILNDRVAGGGDDTIVVTNAGHMLGATLDGLGGDDTAVVTSTADFTTAVGVQNVETLEVSGGGTVSVTLGSAKGWESFSTITGNGATSVTVAVSGDIDATAKTLTQVKNLSYTGGNGTTLTVTDSQIAMVSALGGSIGNNTGTATLAVAGAAIDMSAAGIAGFGTVGLTDLGATTLTLTAAQVGQLQALATADADGADVLRISDGFVLNLTANTLTNWDTLVVSGMGGTITKLTAGQLAALSAVESAQAGGDTVQVAGASVDARGKTFTNIDTLQIFDSGATLTVDAAVLGQLVAVAAAGSGTERLLGADQTLDLSSVALSGFEVIETSHAGDAVITVDDLSGVTEVTAVAGHANTLRTTGTELDVSGITLNNVTRLATSNTAGTVFTGSTGADIIDGHIGIDTFSGGAGADTLTGGGGADIFVDADGDTVTDFGAGDVIRVTGLTGLTAERLKFEAGVLKIDVDDDGVFDDATDVFVTLSGSLNGTFSAADNSGNADITYAPPPSGGGGGSSTPTTTTEDGATVQRTTTTDSSGREQVSIVIAPPTQSREDDPNTPSSDLADVTLASEGSGDAAVPVLLASLPAGIGLTVEGLTERQGMQQALLDLMARIEQSTENGSASQAEMTGIGQAFLDAMPADAQLLVRTVVPVATGGEQPTAPLVITGAADHQEALVIDVRGLPSGTVIELQDVDFAAIVGAVVVRGGTGRNVVTGDSSAQFIVLGADNDSLHGGGGNDTIGSEGGRDVLFGDAGDDTVFGGADHDFLVGGSGNDVLRGDTGMDAVRYTGAWGDYTITRGEGRVLTTVDGRGDDGTDHVESAEILVFSDRIDLAQAPATTVNGFDEAAYLSANQDVATAVQNGWFTSGYQHFQLYGDAENRSANALFDATWYLDNNADVAAAVEAGWMTAWQHYTTWGWQEGRDAGPFFDQSRYLEENADVANADVNPLFHYLQWGWSEGRAAYQADIGIFG